ncbi:MAG: type III pantothenate kinase [Lachnospiraceae bacterium]|nr:type III pantothenate kinase [Lachnospiraceae bacterium]
MILAVDMGNSNIKIGVAKDPRNIIEERVTTSYNKSSLEYATDIMSVLNFHDICKEDLEGAIVSSVVPPLTGIFSSAIRKVLGLEPMVVCPEMKMDISLKRFKYPKGVGADLIVGAEAAYTHYQAPCIIVNLGTATTITAVDSKGDFRGGLILPGVMSGVKALSGSTALLPEISLEKPGRCLSQNTEQCIRGGIVYGTAGSIDAVIDRMEKELDGAPTVIGLGGMARFILPYVQHKVVRDDALLMKGLLKLYELNKS